MRWFFLLAITACTDNATGIVESDIACGSDSTLTYASFGSAFMSTNCLSCHAGKQTPLLTTQAAVQSDADMILDEAVYSSDMPETGSLTNDQRIQLGQWLMCGAP